MSIILEQWNYLYLPAKTGLSAAPEYIMIGAPNNDKAMQSRQQPLDIPLDCVAGQGAIWGSRLFVSPDFVEGDLHNLWYVYNAFMKMDINWHNLD